MAGLQTDIQSVLPARFYKKAVKQEFESEKQGREIYVDVDYVEINIPGDVLNTIDTPARDDHKRKYAQAWAHYQNTQGGDAREIGTPLTEWPRLTPAQVMELKAMKFFTVESIANASDANLNSIKMVAGMSPFALREHAQRFIKIANEDAKTTESDNKTKQLEEELAANKVQMAAMQEQMMQLMAAMNKPKPGRKPKEA